MSAFCIKILLTLHESSIFLRTLFLSSYSTFRIPLKINTLIKFTHLCTIANKVAFAPRLGCLSHIL